MMSVLKAISIDCCYLWLCCLLSSLTIIVHCLIFPMKDYSYFLHSLSYLCVPLDTLKFLPLHVCHCLIVSVIALLLARFLGQTQLFTATEENAAEVMFFICFHFQFYCNSSGDLQLLTERVYCLLHGGFCALWSGK